MLWKSHPDMADAFVAHGERGRYAVVWESPVAAVRQLLEFVGYGQVAS